uniref:RING-type domain-containing protein n=1 Tax=Plectus sambesii TaxID=2011161 RepID=A0A914V5M2_9BILA
MSGSFSGMDTSLSDTMECSVCAELFRDPKQLLCGHTLCASCVSQLVQQARGMTGLGGGLSRNSHAHTMISCPECRQPTAVPPNGLPTNYKLADLVNRFQAIGTACASKQKQCQTCQSKVAAEKLWHCASCSKFSGMETNSMCSDCGVEHHNGHQLLKIATHMVERRNAAIEHTRQCRESSTLLLSQAYEGNMQIVDLLNSLHDSLTEACRDRLDAWIKEMEEQDICSDNYLEKVKEGASNLYINAEEVINRVNTTQQECIQKLQSILGYAVSALSQSSLAKAKSVSNLEAAGHSSASSSSPFANQSSSSLGGLSPAPKLAKNSPSVRGTPGCSGVNNEEINGMFSSPAEQDDDISVLPQSVASVMSLDREEFTRPLAVRLQQRNARLAKRKSTITSRTPK